MLSAVSALINPPAFRIFVVRLDSRTGASQYLGLDHCLFSGGASETVSG